MKIPVQNIYFLLCYAWDKLDMRNQIPVHAEQYQTLPDLFAHLLINGLTNLFKKGLDRNYLEQEVVLAGIRGRINFNASVRNNLFRRQRTQCRFDELQYDILHNQILKTTIKRLLLLNGLDVKLHGNLRNLYNRFHQVSEITLNNQSFSRVQLNRNIRIYEFLLHVCELLYYSLLPYEGSGQYKFQDFTRNDAQMSRLFEAFVRNFYRHEQRTYSVKRDDIRWQLSTNDPFATALLPKLQTDVSLRRSGELLIIECKYVRDILENRYGTEKLRSGHLQQLQSYISQSIESGATVSGILLYASSNQGSFPELRYNHPKGGNLRVCTLNLEQHWSMVRNELLKYIGL